MNNLSDQEKLELLLRVMSELNPLELQRDKDESHKPRTVNEVLKEKRWDCDEIARVYTAIAWNLGITDIAQFAVRLRDKETGEIVGHAAVLYKTETGIFYFDPATENKKQFKGYSSFSDLIQSKDFQNYLSDVCSPYNNSKMGYDFVEGTAVSGKENADAVYYYELGNYYFNQKIDSEALAQYKNALDRGMIFGELYFNIGQCHYFMAAKYERMNNKENCKKEYQYAAEYFTLAVEKSTNTIEMTEYYGYLGDTYIRLNEQTKALETYKTQLRLAESLGLTSQIVDAHLGIATVYINSAGLANNRKKYDNALDYLAVAEKHLFSALKEEKKEEKLNVKEIEEKLNEVRIKRNAILQNKGNVNE